MHQQHGKSTAIKLYNHIFSSDVPAKNHSGSYRLGTLQALLYRADAAEAPKSLVLDDISDTEKQDWLSGVEEGLDAWQVSIKNDQMM